MCMPCAAFLIAVGGLACFHLFLIARGMTTYESVEGTGAIFSEGILTNCWNVWIARTPPSFVDFSLPLHIARQQPLPEIVAIHNPQHSCSNAGTATQAMAAPSQPQMNRPGDIV
jgi:hypothetical protein